MKKKKRIGAIKHALLYIKISLLAILISIIITDNYVHAELVTFQREYIYQASEVDSKVSSRTIALEQVKRLLLEELGTYLESKTEIKNFDLTKDQITTLTAGIVKTEIIDEKWDGTTYALKAKIAANPDEVAKSVDNLRKDHVKTKELEETRKKADNAMKEIERLKQELEKERAEKKLSLKGPVDEKVDKIIRDVVPEAIKMKKLDDAIKNLSAIDWFEKGYASGLAGDHEGAVEAFSMSIKLNPNDVYSYINRAIAYDNLNDYENAIKDYTIALKANPKDEYILYYRGNALYNIGRKEEAIRDYKASARLGNTNAQEYLRSQGIEW
ncbi:MAG: tetratricopeptide repeat protein [Syntrophorhabdaceae bacterium]|nr:tetratricopeptide repeat protein [Syntrophorhabdaceae bacterium]